MTTVDELAARLDALTLALQQQGALVAPPGVSALAAGDMPPHVVSGELITSAWGNSVVDELARQRGQKWNTFSHGAPAQAAVGGWYDLGQTNLGPYTWDCRMTVMVAGIAGGRDATAGCQFDLQTGPGAFTTRVITANIWVQQNYYAYANLFAAWDVPKGQIASFKTRCNVTALTAGTVYLQMQSTGSYYMQRTSD